MSNASTAASAHNTHFVSYRGDKIECNQDTYSEACAELIRRHGEPTPADYPRVQPLLRAITRQIVQNPPKAPVERGEGHVSLEGKARSLAQEDIALTSGFASKPPVYEVGTRVLQLGVDNARRMQEEHDKKPLARDLATDLARTIQAEDRKDLPSFLVSESRMTSSGKIVVAEGATPLPINERAFQGLFGRMPCRAGNAYLADCAPKLRAINYNHWAVELAAREAEGRKDDRTEAVVRTKLVGGERQAFAAVSPSYTAFDCDKIAEALALAFPDDARGSATYDGQRMRVEGLWRTNVAPGEFVAGEFFKAGVIVRADDTGAGSIRVQSVLWRNLCLNLIILDKAIGVDVRIRHMGSVETLAARFREAFEQALNSVSGFRKAWGYAMAERDEVLVERVRAAAGDEVRGLSAREMLPGLFNGILEAELVPVKGRKADVIPKLLEMHRQDEAADAYGVSRASIANAFTRYAHVVETDAFAADEIREGAGTLLSGFKGRDPRPLPYRTFAA